MAVLPLNKIAPQPLEDQVYQELQQAIMTGKIKQSDKLVVRTLAESIGTSDMPIRAALNRLIAEGALVKLPSSGTSVLPQITQTEFVEAMMLRSILEERATILATPNLKRTHIKKLNSIISVIRRANEVKDVEGHLNANFQFKHTLYEQAKAPILHRFIKMLWLRIGPFLHHIPPAAYSGELSVDIDEQVIEAIKQEDAEKAGLLIREDIESASRLLVGFGDIFNNVEG